uniref:Uncharacterized protein n=1 Tax=Paramoeba aestuarina TaxID=180227 RepID=A0A7S4PCD7_9EUKA|mmetsp:Transcript_40081/g.63379  ORF Transcript_40081/g.63379 Transcript_40081/m.63379 type:complete len:170 (+) Transcript_40081:171-680(+)|eukprot:CAMPEP_0201506248 /NCGR_PEP_ID=MMETSP0161_2-20130828/186_1 /ASSEMBLY_ACC=CAM_ASM_000251 /TAXON_ID=180227 /ORGANISM="Neoparamoeba aestuarina, Strain SoJaBio B1-5/56/2" /LENGTH=169 /DNA_ID=CAMNT_0047900287 /DNA_START=149 /DNA_END=658 /DNA_ORIENTATION=-
MKVFSAILLVVALFGAANALTCENERCCEIAQQGLMYYGNYVWNSYYGNTSAPGTLGITNSNCAYNQDVFSRAIVCPTQDDDYFYPDELVRVCPRNYALYNLMCESQSDLTGSFPVVIDGEDKDQYESLQDCLDDVNSYNYNYDKRQCLDFWYTAFDRCMRSLGIRGGN